MKHIFFTLCILLAGVAHAQVGYQVALLDSRTGEPRTNEKVSVTVKISDSKGATVCSEQLTATSDAFGVLSLTVGNENTFANVNWQNLPLSISATVDGILIGSCNILNVPVAEYAKRTGVLTPEILTSKSIWTVYNEKYTFTANYTGTITYGDGSSYKCSYEIDGNNLYIFWIDVNGTPQTCPLYYSHKQNKLFVS